MKVKIGNKLYSTTNQPIMIIFSAIDIANIKNLSENDKYCGFPIGSDRDEIRKWMDEIPDVVE